MPTTRFRYAAFKGISVSNKVITSENVGSLETNNADLTGNVSLPATTTFDGTPLGSASTANVVGTVTAGVDEIPTSAAVNTAITTLDDKYKTYHHPISIPEFEMRLPINDVYQGDNFNVDIYATSTGSKDKWLKSGTIRIVYFNAVTALSGAVNYVSVSNSRLFNATFASNTPSGAVNLLEINLAQNYGGGDLEKPYMDLKLCTITFNFVGPKNYYSQVFSQLQIASLINGVDDSEYITDVPMEATDGFDLIGTVKVGYIKNPNGVRSTSTGNIYAADYIRLDTLTTGAYGIGANALRLDPTSGEIQLSTT